MLVQIVYYDDNAGSRTGLFQHQLQLPDRVATRPGFRGMSRICAMLTRVPADQPRDAKCPGFQDASKTQNYNNNNNNNNNNSSNLIYK